MGEILENIRELLPIMAFFWGAFLLHSLWRPQKILNCFLLMAALLFSMFFVAGLFGSYASTVVSIELLLVTLAILLVPAMLVWNGLIMLRREGRSLSSMLSLLCGILVGIGELAFALAALQSTELLKPTKILPIYGFVGYTVFYFSLWILAFVLYMVFIQLLPHGRRFEYIIIHGCGLLEGERISRLLQNRLDKAIELYHACGGIPVLIPSGGRGEDERISEAEAMSRYLREQGISEEHILPECASATTMENLQFSKALIEERGGSKRVALVSSNYHVYRCLLYASRLGFRCRGVGAGVAWYYWPSATLREFVAVFSKWPHVFWLLLGYSPVLLVFLG